MAEYAEVIVMDNTQHPTFLFVHSNDESKNYQCSMEIDEENSQHHKINQIPNKINLKFKNNETLV